MLFAWQGPMIHLLTFHLNWRTTRGLRLPLLEDHEHFFCFFTAYWFDEIVYVHTILSSCLKVCTYYIHRKIHWVEKKEAGLIPISHSVEGDSDFVLINCAMICFSIWWNMLFVYDVNSNCLCMQHCKRCSMRRINCSKCWEYFSSHYTK